MTRTSARPALVLAIVALTFVGAACSSSDDASSGDSGAKASTTVASGGDDSTTAPDSGSDSGSDDDSSSGAKGTGTVTLVDGEAAADKTITVTADGTFDPDSLEVAVGEKFTVKAAEGAGTHAVTFDGDDSYTVSGGLIETFTIDAAGTYEMSDTISESTATITVS